jgi:hypothetical protein
MVWSIFESCHVFSSTLAANLMEYHLTNCGVVSDTFYIVVFELAVVSIFK